MKKFGIIFGIIFSLLLSFVAVFYNAGEVVLAEDENNVVSISSFEELRLMTESKTYELSCDLGDDENEYEFTSIENFTGTFDGKGHTIKNIKVSSENRLIALFSKTNNAQIKNLKIDKITIEYNETAETYSPKVAILIAEAKSTTISEVEIVNSEIDSNTKSTTTVGGLIASAKDGCKIYNCKFTSTINFENSVAAKTNYVGGLVAYSINSQIHNVISDVKINVKSLGVNSYVGGIIGYVSGNVSKFINIVSVSSIDDKISGSECNTNFVGSIFGYITTKTSDIPYFANIEYLYTNSSVKFIGNKEELQNAYTNEFITQNVATIKEYQISQSTMYAKDFYSYTNNKFENVNYYWNTDSIWYIQDMKGLPVLQLFQSYKYTLSEDNSFYSIQKPNIGKKVIIFGGDKDDLTVNEYDGIQSGTFEYGGSIKICAYITSDYKINKFFDIVGLRKNNEIIYSSTELQEAIKNNNTELYDQEIVSFNEVYGHIFLRRLKGSRIWYGKNVDYNIVFFKIDNCNLSDEGAYSLVLEPREFDLSIETENIEYGTVRRYSAVVKNSVIKDKISYGKTLEYEVDPVSDFAFKGWTLSLEEGTEPITNLSKLSILFNENLFAEGGYFNGIDLFADITIDNDDGDNAIHIYATFTKKVCDVKIKFAVNNVITDDWLASVYYDGKEVASGDNGYSVKAAMGAIHNFEFTLPTGYSTSNFYKSDGQNNLGDIATDTQLAQLEITYDDKEMTLVINLTKIEEEKTDYMFILWISLGVLGAGGIVVIIVVKVKGKGNSGYKGMYY